MEVDQLAYWSVPPLWTGKTVAVLASGPSMSQSVAESVRKIPIPAIAVNTTFRLAPWADMLYAADIRWWEKYAKEIAEFAGLKVTCDSGGVLEGVHVLRNTGRVGFDPDPGCVRTGGNSGYQAIHVAAQAGAERILLLGFDMRAHGPHQMHWHARHPEPLRNASDGIFERWLSTFDTLASELKQRGIRVINCTPGSALMAWPNMALEEAIHA